MVLNKLPLSVLENVPIKMGDFQMSMDFVILDIARDAFAQIILRRPFLAAVGYRIHVKSRQLTFDLGDHHAEFGIFKDQDSSFASFAYCGCDVPISNEIVKSNDLCYSDPYMIDLESTVSQGLSCTLLNLVANFVASIAKDMPCAVSKGPLSDYYRFARVLMSFPPLDGVDMTSICGLTLVVAHLIISTTR